MDIKTNNIITICKKELSLYFVSPIGYIVFSLFLILAGILFFMTGIPPYYYPVFLVQQAEMRSLFSILPLLFSVFIPPITMRLFSEEISTGSFELLMTLPVSSKEAVLGKFLAAFASTTVMVVPTLLYVFFISLLGDLDQGAVFGGYVAIIFLAAAYCSIGIFASIISENQIVAFILGVVICFALTLINKILFFLPETLLDIIKHISSGYHFQNISKGVLDFRDFLYYAVVTFIFLYATMVMVEEKTK
jgi:ABC-2 type transport system permease protein